MNNKYKFNILNFIIKTILLTIALYIIITISLSKITISELLLEPFIIIRILSKSFNSYFISKLLIAFSFSISISSILEINSIISNNRHKNNKNCVKHNEYNYYNDYNASKSLQMMLNMSNNNNIIE